MSETTDESKRNRRTAKRILAIGLPLVLIAGAGVGYAYWTTTGGGTGTAATSSTAPSVTVAVDTAYPLTALAPGLPTQTIHVKITNATGAPSAHVTSVTASTASVTGGTPATGCTTADYILGNPTMTITPGPVDIAPGGTATTSGATLAFNNTGAVQDACKGATVNLSFSVA